MILTCGKTINLLRLSTSSSPVVNFTSSLVTDPIELIMTPEQVQEKESLNFCFVRLSWDRCYDLKNIFANIRRKIWRF
jgi:hypothetical protein